MGTIAVLAYGSLIDDPGSELGPLITGRQDVQTPFPVEYARSSQSRTRGGAPTLVPFDDGSAVAARLLLLDHTVSLAEVKDMLWRRETRKDVGRYEPPTRSGANTVLVEELDRFEGVDSVLYTRIAPNIVPLTAERLAELAIQSARNPGVTRNENGIAYLRRATLAGVVTPLTAGYETAVLRRLRADSLEHALRLIYDGPPAHAAP